jgi:hypothetical protein
VTRCSGVAATRRGRGQQQDDCAENRLRAGLRPYAWTNRWETTRVSGSSRCRFPPAARRARPARSTPGRAVARGGSRRSSTAASDVRAPVRRCARSDAIGRRRDRFAQQSREPPADEDVDPVELRVTAPLRPASLSSRRAIPSSQSTASPRAGSKRWASSSAVANASAHRSAANPRSCVPLAKCSSNAATWRR